MTSSGAFPRAAFLQGGGLLLVGLTTAGAGTSANGTQPAVDAYPIVDPAKLDSWLAVGPDGKVSVFTGRVDLGQHKSTAFAQIVAEELDVPFSSVTVIMGDTARTVNQGASTSSDGLFNGAKPLRHAAAEARYTLVGLAAQRFGVTPDQLTVKDGVVRVVADPAKSAAYGDLIGTQRFNINLKVTQPDTVLVDVSGSAKLKDPATYSIVGKDIPSLDIPPKVRGVWPRVHNYRTAGMLHARLALPPAPGAHVVSVGTLSGFPDVRVVNRGDFVAVVAASEWTAIRAYRKLSVTWTQADPLPTTEGIFTYLRTPTGQQTQKVRNDGDVDKALAGSAKTFTAQYNYPIQTHGMIGPSCAVADVTGQRAIVYSGTQDPPSTRTSVATLLGLSAGNVRIVPLEASGAYGRLGVDDAAAAAAVLSQQLGKPVRVQFMRDQEHRWSPLQPPSAFTLRAGVDASGAIVAWHHEETSWSFVTDPLPTMLLPGGKIEGKLPPLFRPPGGGEISAYSIPNLRIDGHVAAPLLRGLFMRSPGRIQVNFAGEQFLDEIAAATGQDPIALRLRHAADARTSDVLTAAEKASGWQRRPSPVSNARSTARVAAGRGIAVVASQRGSYVATVAEIEVDRQTGIIRVKRIVVAVDPGIVVNPTAIKAQIEGATIFSTSRALKEEVKYNRSELTTVDWITYPILRFTEVPDVEIVLINRIDKPPGGIGEPPNTTPAAAIGNAFFDATGVRLRQLPFTPERVKAALKA